MEYSDEQKIEAIKKILKFNSLITINCIKNTIEINDDIINAIKLECKKIMDIYQFDFSCDNLTLLD